MLISTTFREFLETGVLSPLIPGMQSEQIRALLGKPDNILRVPTMTRDIKAPESWMYSADAGSAFLGFKEIDTGLASVGVVWWGGNLSSPFVFDDEWIQMALMSSVEMEDYLRRENLKFQRKAGHIMTDSGRQKTFYIELESGATFLWSGKTLGGIRTKAYA